MRRPPSREAHHMFHRSASMWTLGSTDSALIFTYILGILYIAAMFSAMATDWDVQSILWFCCAGFALIAMLVSTIVRDAFEDTLVKHLYDFKSAPDTRGTYARAPVGLMPRMTLYDLVPRQP